MHEPLAWVAADVVEAFARRPATAAADDVAAALVADHDRRTPATSDLDWEAAAEPTVDRSGAVGMWERLAHLRMVYGLDGVDVRLLTILAAADLDANLALAYDLLSGTTGQPGVTVGLALELSGHGSLDGAARARLAPSGRLGRAGLVLWSGNTGFLRRRLQAPDRVVNFLLGDDTTAVSVIDSVVEPVGLPLPGHELAARALERGAPLTWVREASGAAGLSLCAGAADAAEVARLCIDARRLPSPLPESVATVLLEAGLLGAVLILDHADRLAEAPVEEAGMLFATLHRNAVPVLACARRVWNPDWLADLPILVEAGVVPSELRQQLWSDLLRGEEVAESHDSEWKDLVRLRITPEEIVRTVRAATLEAGTAGVPLTLARVRSTVRKLAGGAVQGATNRSASVTFDDLVLEPETLQHLQEIADWSRHREEVLNQGPVTGAGGKGEGIVALFAGGPGTGKTLAATVVASALGLDLQTVDLSAVVDKYIGETEKNLEKVFAEAEALNAVLFFDEADALFGSRSSVTDARDRYANQEVAYLLQRIETFNGIAILATNLRGNLDAAFSRRMHFIVHFPDPDAATRARLWTRHLSALSTLDPDDPIDVEMLGERVELAGGDIRNIVLAAAYRAAVVRRPVGGQILAEATTREFRKLGRRTPEHGFR